MAYRSVIHKIFFFFNSTIYFKTDKKNAIIKMKSKEKMLFSTLADSRL